MRCVRKPHTGVGFERVSRHLDASIPNFLIQECRGQAVPQTSDKVWEEWLGFPAMGMVNGKHLPPEKPGLGFELAEGLSGNIRSPDAPDGARFSPGWIYGG